MRKHAKIFGWGMAASCSLALIAIPVVPVLAQAAAPAPAATAGAAAPAQAPAKPAAGGFQLQIGMTSNPDCLKKGDCSLDDIVVTAASAANLLTILSGALFLVAFIYGGFMYLISFGDSGKVTTGKTAMKTAVIGMIIVLGAYTIVSYVVQSITGAPVK